MARGKQAEPGATRVSANGYHYTKVSERGWVLTHRLVAEGKLGRKLNDNERTRFVDGNRENLRSDNIEVFEVKNNKEERKKTLRDKIEMYQQELADLEAEDATS